MAISSITDMYNKLVNNIASTTVNSTNNSNASTKTSSSQDKVDLNSSLSNLSGYLNYGSKGLYNMPSLADYLNNDSSTDSGDGSDDLSSILGTEDNGLSSIEDSLLQSDDGSTSDAFQQMATEKTQEINDLISKALEKMKAQKTE